MFLPRPFFCPHPVTCAGVVSLHGDFPAFPKHLCVHTVGLDWSHLFEHHAPCIPRAVVAAAFQVQRLLCCDVTIFCVTRFVPDAGYEQKRCFIMDRVQRRDVI